MSAANYASRVDNILLDVTGKQRYGTQMTCRKGKVVLVPLESVQDLERLRAEVGLPSMKEQWRTTPPFCK
jgi:hypothetical protein